MLVKTVSERAKHSAILGVISLAGFVVSLPISAAEPVRMAMEVFGSEAQIEVRGMPRTQAEAAVRQALLEIHAIEQLADPSSTMQGGVGDVERNSASGKTTGVQVDPRTFTLLRRGMQFCLWSSGAFGPLGGGIYDLWREGIPPTLELRGAVSRANCSLLQLATKGENDPSPRVGVPRQSNFDLRGMAVGFAVDRAIEVLLQAGASNAFVEIGTVMRAIGNGPDGEGWLVSVPGISGTRNPLDQIYLQNQSMALRFAPSTSAREPQLLDLRTGVPSRGVVLIAAVSELAIDTEALAATLFVVGHSQGQLLLGRLNPRPSILWQLGQLGGGTPLESRYHWASLSRLR